MNYIIIQNHCNEIAILHVLLTSFARHFPEHADALNQDGGYNGEDIVDTNEPDKHKSMGIDRTSGGHECDDSEDVCIVSGDNRHSAF